jgi:ABC-2 type transport system permease protein
MFVFIGTFSIVDSMAMGTFFFGIINLPEKIRTGSLDIMIAKPIDTQFFVSAESFNPGSLFGIITGSCMVMYGLSSGGYVVSMIQVLGYILLLIMMYLLFYSMMLIVRTLAFIFVKINTLTQVEDSVIEFAFRIPGTAFKGISKVIFMVGLIATVPTEHITNMLEPSQWLIVTGITLFFFGLARFMFKFGMGRYTSASS